MKILHRIVLQYVFFIIFWYGVTTAFFFGRREWWWTDCIMLHRKNVKFILLVLVSSRIEQWNPKRFQEFSSTKKTKVLPFFRAAKKTKERGLTCHLIVRTSRKSRQSSFTRNHYEKLPCTSFRQFPNKNKSRVNHFNINDCHCNFLC